MTFHLFVVPYELGTEEVGEGRGPGRLIAEGVDRPLHEADPGLRTERVELERAAPRESETGRTFELARRLSLRVTEAVRAHRFPVVLGGSCFTSVGVVAGLGAAPGRPRVGIAWLDAHGDFNTPETTPSGYLDGMPLAVITGRGWTALRQQLPGFRPLPDRATALIGARDLDPLEEKLLRRSGVKWLPAKRWRARGGSADRSETYLSSELAPLRRAVDLLHVHVDLDVLDPGEAPANHYPAPGGLSVERVRGILRVLFDRFRVGSITFAAYDPSCDPDRKVPPIVRTLLSTVVESEPTRAHHAPPARVR